LTVENVEAIVVRVILDDACALLGADGSERICACLLQRGNQCRTLGVPAGEGISTIAPDFTHRADLTQHPEHMDQPCDYDDLRACLRDIARVNRLTRAYAPTLQWLNSLHRRLPLQSRPLHIVDVGCGYGDMLRRIYDWSLDIGLPVTLTGIDLNPAAIRAAREITLPGRVTFLDGNAYDFAPPGGIDLVISSLMTHHMEDSQIIAFLAWMEATARLGWFINDLHRQPIPYHLFRTFGPFTNLHPFVKHDGPVSILRSFRRDEWERLLRHAAVPMSQVRITEFRPARLCVARLR